jgi:prepilin-type N-terminal cleavage/methylation domain-containing protein
MNIKKGRPAMLDKIREIIAARIHDENDRSDEEGFTLIELLIVIIVLGILAAVTVFGLSGASSQSAKSACKSDVRTTEAAIDAYHTQAVDASWPSIADLVNPTSTAAFPNALPAPFLRTPPGDPPHYTIALTPTPPPAPGTNVPEHVTVNGADFDQALSSGAANPCDAVT